MFQFNKKCFFLGLTLLTSVNSLSCISMTNKQVRPEIVNVNSDEPAFYSSSIKTSKCSGSCNNINDPYPKMCVPDIVKNLNVKVFNLMSRANETRHIKCHETYKCKCRLDASVCNNKQRWNEYKCRCECKELIDKGVCGEEYIWNPCNCECEYDKTCDVGEYLDYENCKCRKRLVDKLVDECTETVEKVEIAKNMRKCDSCMLWIALLSINFTINVRIGTYFVYFHWCLKKDVPHVSCSYSNNNLLNLASLNL